MSHSEQSPPEHRHQDFQLDTGGVFKAGVALFLFVLLAVGGLLGAYFYWLTPAPADQVAENDSDELGFLPARQSVTLDADQGGELKNYNAEQRQLLDSYGWLDEERKTARIPIDRAMDILGERGLPTRPQPEESK